MILSFVPSGLAIYGFHVGFMPGLQLSAFSQLRVFVASVIRYLRLTLAVQTIIKS